MAKLFCEKLKTEIQVIEKDKKILLKRIQEKEILESFNFLNVSVDRVDQRCPTFKDAVSFFEETILDLIDIMKDSSSCVLQFYGELLPNALAEYYRYICTDKENSRFYFPEVSQSSKSKGYLYSWITFEYNKRYLESMKFSHRTTLSGFFIENEAPGFFECYFKQPWSEPFVFCELLKKCVTYFDLDYDFDSFNILTRRPIDEMIIKLKKGLQQFEERSLNEKS